MTNYAMFILLLLLLVHWIGDFVFRIGLITKGKSTSILLLLEHQFWYALVMSAGLFMMLSYPPFGLTFHNAALFVFFVVGLHLVTDYVVSKIKAFAFNKAKVHTFFIMSGFDQLVHVSTLILAANCFLI